MSACPILSRFLVVSAWLTMAAPAPAVGQADSGLRVRVTSRRPSQRLVGTLVSLQADSLRLTSSKDHQPVALPIGSVVRLERSLGRRSQTGHGAMVGGVALGATGLLLGLVASADDGSWVEIGPGEILAVTAFFAAAGAGVGALIGSASRTDRWETIPLPVRSNPQAVRSRKPLLRLALKF